MGLIQRIRDRRWLRYAATALDEGRASIGTDLGLSTAWPARCSGAVRPTPWQQGIAASRSTYGITFIPGRCKVKVV
ncbi:hypothetical protein Tgr7_1210 [Thioalkalivibrio sulfidiphilus HL-EbGr7]|uniref:Uncharacterized protein n=1 Tax=Thioalkalivibrio sulfidiphilus (strain HL-EbGR7) TaxID=396588 RepID=B8GQA1_THISH|nr:hypothetical protein [Thioalkalivibrio sulfidiphilus]ACL72296.1 hypothetical protein Tgr7_1210 [Thioalkalivibrio sulfidiphilus HL-EbGr7]